MVAPVASSSSERGPPSSASPANVSASSPHVSTTTASASLSHNDAASKSPTRVLHSQIPLDNAPPNVWTRRSSKNPTPTVERIAADVVRTSVPEEVLIDSQPLWTDWVAGYFIDEPPSIAKLHATVNRLWRTKKQTAFLDVRFLNPTTALIQIPNTKSRDWVLEKGVWHIGTTPMIVKQWSPTNAKAPVDMSRIPVWVDLHDVPDSLYAEKGLKFLGDIVGKYLKLHSSTEKCLSLEVARVLVEVNFETDLIKAILLTEQEGDITIRVSYPWVPRKCEACQIWGHDLKTCTKSSRKEDQLPKGNENQSDSLQGSETKKTMAVGQASPNISNAGNTNEAATKSPKLNGVEDDADKASEQSQSQLNENQFVAADTEGWEVAKGRKSPRKAMVHQEVTDTAISPNQYRVLQEEETEDGEIAVEDTNENDYTTHVETEVENSQHEESVQTGLNVADDLSVQISLENESTVVATRNLHRNTGGTRGGRGRGRPRKNNNSYSDISATTNNKSIKASFGKH